jgi:alpha-tubulin suppressor-like RCC1 family protein
LNLKFWVRASKPQTSSLAVDGRVFEWGNKERRKKTERKTERERAKPFVADSFLLPLAGCVVNHAIPVLPRPSPRQFF